MASPVMVENVTIPLRVKKVAPTAPKNNNNNDETKGFPFDETDFGGEDRSFRSHIDDIVKRHPELAGHLNFDRDFDRFPFRSNTWGHKRRGSSSAAEEARPSGSTEHPESRRFARPFGSRFEERFGFPFSRTFDGEPEYYQQQKAQPQPQAQPKPQTQQQPKPQAQQQAQAQPQPEPEPQQPQQQEEKSTEKPPLVPNNDRGRNKNPNIPQSSTVDLGQKQDPVPENRGQRSMSAPPENRAGPQRFVSSINIPIQSGGEDASAQQQPPPQQQQWQQQQPKPQQPQQSKFHERVIPIHVEGRDEPVIPRRGTPTFSQPPPQPERVFPPPPQPERVFGQRPAGFGNWDRAESPYYTGEQYFPNDPQFFSGEPQYFDSPQFFANRGEPHPEEYFAGPFRQQQQQQQQQYQKPQQQKPQPPPQQPQQQAPPPQQQQQQPPAGAPSPQQQQTPPPQPPPPKAGPIDHIQCIQKDVLQLMSQVESFNGKPKDKQYLYLDEMLTRNLLKLDDVETEGKENIRQARKEAINCIQRCISILEAKAAANEQLRNALMMEVDGKAENTNAISAEPIPLTSLEVSGVAKSGAEVLPSEQPVGNNEQVENAESATPMEVSPPAPTESAEVNNCDIAVLVQPTEAPEVEKPNEEPAQAEPVAEVKEGEQPKVENVEQAATGAGEAAGVSEQPAGDVNSSQATEAIKEEVKDKKEKKKVKKKEKTADKAEKK